jgi:N-acetylmuramoyl-L-alanine amidase
VRRLAPLAVAALALLGAARPPGLGELVAIHHWSFRDYSRIVLELSGPVAVQAGEAPADAGAGHPARLYFDLPDTWARRDLRTAVPVADGLLQRVRVGQNTLDTARVVLDLERYGRHRVLRLASPDRVVIDVFAPDAPRGGASALPVGLRPARVVVVDAGHGGRDPGAIGIDGLREKDVTLALARVLEKKLRAKGFDVVMTRRRDRTLSLVERTAIAEGAGGDVFVSLHANASPRPERDGLELFTLDPHAERQTLRLAARENGVALAAVDPLQRLVAELRLSEAGERSGLLASYVHRTIAQGMGARWPSAREPARKHGPFYVLYLSDMPALLVEAGFVTHEADVARLRDPAYLDALAATIARGVERYRDAAAPVVAERRP